MKNTLVMVIVSFLITGCSALGQRYGEEALYATLFSDSDYEIRLYEPLVIAQTPAEGSYRQATRIGYQRLTAYVSGNNLAKQVISAGSSENGAVSKAQLTTPYYEEFIDGIWLTSVAIPEKYSLATLPRPSNDLITFQVIPRIKTAVIGFSGIRTEGLINKKADQLLQWIKQEGLTETSAARSVIFDTPMTLPGLNRHEIHITVQ